MGSTRTVLRPSVSSCSHTETKKLFREFSIRLTARKAGTRAAARFGGDRITGLAALVDCSRCSLCERDMAVWAFGELRDGRA